MKITVTEKKDIGNAKYRIKASGIRLKEFSELMGWTINQTYNKLSARTTWLYSEYEFFNEIVNSKKEKG